MLKRMLFGVIVLMLTGCATYKAEYKKNYEAIRNSRGASNLKAEQDIIKKVSFFGIIGKNNGFSKFNIVTHTPKSYEGTTIDIYISNNGNTPIRINAFADSVTLIDKDNKAYAVDIPKNIDKYNSEIINPNSVSMVTLKTFDPAIASLINNGELVSIQYHLGLDKLKIVLSPFEATAKSK